MERNNFPFPPFSQLAFMSRHTTYIYTGQSQPLSAIVFIVSRNQQNNLDTAPTHASVDRVLISFATVHDLVAILGYSIPAHAAFKSFILLLKYTL